MLHRPLRAWMGSECANQQVVITHARAPEIRPLHRPRQIGKLAWRQGMVSFDGESLQIAAAEINRHNRRQIVIDDPLLAAKPVVGLFRATDLNGFSAAAAEALKARAIFDGDVIESSLWRPEYRISSRLGESPARSSHPYGDSAATVPALK